MTAIVFRPLPAWTDPVTAPRRSHNFKATWTSTLTKLRTEVENLSATWDGGTIVLQVQADESAMRRDGGIRADARVRSPGVVVSFDSRHGPLRYACDTFTDTWYGQAPGWQANVRAIALGLEALRAVDRYGIAGRGEQYVGFTQLARPMGPVLSVDDAGAFLLRFQHHPGEFTRDALRRTEVRTVLYRRAAAKLHPDRNGDADEFRRLTAAHQLLKETWG